MKKLFSILFVLLVGYGSVIAQTQQYSGAPTQLTGFKGGVIADSGMYLPKTLANYPWFDSCGRIWFNKKGDSAVYFNNCKQRLRVLSLKDTGLIKALVGNITGQVDSGVFATRAWVDANYPTSSELAPSAFSGSYNDLINKLTAGSGISISGNAINNTGVLSINGISGALIRTTLAQYGITDGVTTSQNTQNVKYTDTTAVVATKNNLLRLAPYTLKTDSIIFSSKELKRVDTNVLSIRGANHINGYYLNTIDSGADGSVIGEGSGTGEIINGYDAANHILRRTRFMWIGPATYQNIIDSSIASAIIHSFHSKIIGGGGHNAVVGGSYILMNGRTEYSGTLSGSEDTVDNAPYSSILVASKSSIRRSGYGIILSGDVNKLDSSFYGMVLNGSSNNMYLSDRAFIANGTTNTVTNSPYALIGTANTSYVKDATSGVIVSGILDTVIGSNYSSIINGRQNKILNGTYNTIFGFANRMTNAQSSFIAGAQNSIDTVANSSVPVTAATIAGGQVNKVYDSYGGILGGNMNTIGGRLYTYGQYATISGGLNNTVGNNQSSRFSGVFSGRNDTVNGEYSAILYGRNCKVIGTTDFYGFASGFNATASALGAVAWSDGSGTGITNNTTNSFATYFANGYRFTGGGISTSQPSANGAGTMLIGKMSLGSDSKPYWEVSIDGSIYYIPLFTVKP